MRIVINHITRMEQGYFCAAGVDWTTGNHVRPILPIGRLRNALLECCGGPFDMANIIELGSPTPYPSPPHVEDYLFAQSGTRLVRQASPERFWRFLYAMSKPTLRDIFGSDLKRLGPASCGTDEGLGRASLGCVHPLRRPLLYVDEPREPGDAKARIRLRMTDGEFDLALSVTDIRLYGPDHVTPDPEIVALAAARIRQAEDIVLSVGLGRAKRFTEDAPAVHYLQVNNIHLKEDPTWALRGIAPDADSARGETWEAPSS